MEPNRPKATLMEHRCFSPSPGTEYASRSRWRGGCSLVIRHYRAGRVTDQLAAKSSFYVTRVCVFFGEDEYSPGPDVLLLEQTVGGASCTQCGASPGPALLELLDALDYTMKSSLLNRKARLERRKQDNPLSSEMKMGSR